MRLRKGVTALGFAGAIAIGAVTPAVAAESAAQPKLKAEFTDTDASDGQIGVRIDGCESGKLTIKSQAFAKTAWNAKTHIFTATLKKGLDDGVYSASTRCAGLDPVIGAFNLADGKVTSAPAPAMAAWYIDADATDRKIAVGIDGCESDKLTVKSSAFAKTAWNPKTNVFTATFKKGIPERAYGVSTHCTGIDPVRGGLELTNGKVVPAPAPPLVAWLTDADATDRQIAMGVDGCESGQLRVESAAFAKTEWNAKTHILTATLKKGLAEGVHTATTYCAGMQPVEGKFKYADGMVAPADFPINAGTPDTPDNADEDTSAPERDTPANRDAGGDTAGQYDQTTVVPTGGVQTGGGGTASSY